MQLVIQSFVYMPDIPGSSTQRALDVDVKGDADYALSGYEDGAGNELTDYDVDDIMGGFGVLFMSEAEVVAGIADSSSPVIAGQKIDGQRGSILFKALAFVVEGRQYPPQSVHFDTNTPNPGTVTNLIVMDLPSAATDFDVDTLLLGANLVLNGVKHEG